MNAPRFRPSVDFLIGLIEIRYSWLASKPVARLPGVLLSSLLP